jgi:hypothetical protein
LANSFDDRIHVYPIDRLWQTNGTRIERGTVGRGTPEGNKM